MLDADFDFLRAYLKERSGLSLSAEKRYLIDSRLGPVCRRFALTGVPDLVTKLRQGRDRALETAVVEAMTTNETFFFRDKTPFDIFKDTILPQMLSARAGKRKLRIWCAAASSGQEPYSLAMLLDEARTKFAGWQIEIVATDIAAEVLDKAKAGIYTQFEVQRGLPIQMLLKYFQQKGDSWHISPAIKSMVTFKQMNLIKDFSQLGHFDVIYCRNVLIYFDQPTKTDVLRRLSAALAPDGVLLLGAAETVIGLTDALAPHASQRGLYVASGAGRAGAGQPATDAGKTRVPVGGLRIAAGG
ncbi:protein-glutamate O-methyltransferase CheR [Saliniramus sp.]|uniref:CheR family methyltransferase n=1 Tax=Saliniramus sp. TaxID=2986772 RepID=UPI002B7C066E|nr:protein-glutamate O-methyltransferase CheR [Saliniramus sp.]HMB11143.1 protein-glutamate O-methyltransferase CheR [Saliniramus sp.]